MEAATLTTRRSVRHRIFSTGLFSTDHRVIARQYFFLSLFAVVVGVCLSLLMRFHLVWPQAKVSWFEKIWSVRAESGIMTEELYLSLMTLHGTIMVFFVLTLAPLNAFANLVLPEQLGQREMAFPRLNMLSFWVTMASFLTLIASCVLDEGGPIAGWTAYPPLSAVGSVSGPGEGLGQTFWFFSIGVFCIGSLLSAMNIISTVIECRRPGMSLMQMPLTCWNWFVTAILSVLSFPVLLAAGLLILLDRLAGTSFFVPGDLLIAERNVDHSGGSPLLWQHLFWFFGHPEVYIAILPGMGIVSHIISNFSRRPPFSYRASVWAPIAIAFLGMLVWGHHMFISGISPYSALTFSLVTMSIGAPSAALTLNWLGTAFQSPRLELNTAMLFCLGFVSLFVTGGLTGLFLGQPEIDAYFHDTAFVVAHFHMIMGMAALFAVFAATFYWFPLMFGRMLGEELGKLHFYLTFVGAYALFLPMHFAGFAGNPRRYADFTNFDFLKPVMPLQRWITMTAFALGAVQLIFIWNLFWSMLRGAPAPSNPWSGATLEWNPEGELPGGEPYFYPVKMDVTT